MCFSNESIGVTTGRAFCGVVGHRDRHEYTGTNALDGLMIGSHYAEKFENIKITSHFGYVSVRNTREVKYDYRSLIVFESLHF